jgi:predicted metal-dependent hydrolase
VKQSATRCGSAASIARNRQIYRTGDLFRRATWSEAIGFLFGRKGLAWAFARAWVDYLRPGFKPQDRGDAQVARDWPATNAVWFR